MGLVLAESRSLTARHSIPRHILAGRGHTRSQPRQTITTDWPLCGCAGYSRSAKAIQSGRRGEASTATRLRKGSSTSAGSRRQTLPFTVAVSQGRSVPSGSTKQTKMTSNTSPTPAAVFSRASGGQAVPSWRADLGRARNARGSSGGSFSAEFLACPELPPERYRVQSSKGSMSSIRWRMIAARSRT